MVGVSKESLDLVAKRKEELRRLLPEIFTEGKLDLNKLKQALGEELETSGERYSFSWAGKSTSIKLRDKRSKATLTPSKKESVDFDETDNVFIEGENMEALKILQKAYQGKVKMIYIDPPYNTGKDFVYKDDFSDSLKNYLKYTGQTNGNGEKTSTNTETSGRYHSNWLTMMYPRLALARNLLREDGIIFISIDDNEVHNLRLVLNEIFGEENFIGQIVWKSKYGAGAKTTGIIEVHEYVVCYARNNKVIKAISVPLSDKLLKIYNKNDEKYESRGSYGTWPLETTSMADRPNLRFPIRYNDAEIWPKKQWLWSKQRVEEAIKNNEIVFNKSKEGKWSVRFKGYLKNQEGTVREGTPTSLIDDIYTQDGTNELSSLFPEGKIFDFPKPSKLIGRLLGFKVVTDLGENTQAEIILDFFAGSGTTAQAVLEQNVEDGGHRRFIVVQLPEPTPEGSEARKAGYKTIADICKERIRRVIKKLKENGKQQKIGDKGKQDIGFKVFKLSKSNCFVWDEEKASDPNTLARHIEESAKGAAKADPDALLYEIMLKEGFALDSKIEKAKHGKNEFYRVAENGHRLFACFDEKIDEDSVKKLNLEKDDKLVVLDSALSDTQKVNLARKMRIETV